MITIRERWKIVTLYSRNMRKTMKYLNKEIEKEEEELLVLRGENFNERTGNKGGPIINIGRKKVKKARKSRNKVTNKNEQLLINGIKERGWIFNGF